MQTTAAKKRRRKPQQKSNRTKPSAYVLRQRIFSMRKKGSSNAAICRSLGISHRKLRELDAHRPRPRADQLNRSSWCAFLQHLTREAEGEPRTVASCPLPDNQARAYYRWTEEGVAPSLFSADRFLVVIDMHIDDFFAYCEENDLKPWARDEEPDWHCLDKAKQVA